jgi:hypothetical protein
MDLDTLFGQSPAGLLTPDDQQSANQNALMAAACYRHPHNGTSKIN